MLAARRQQAAATQSINQSVLLLCRLAALLRRQAAQCAAAKHRRGHAQRRQDRHGLRDKGRHEGAGSGGLDLRQRGHASPKHRKLAPCRRRSAHAPQLPSSQP